MAGAWLIHLVDTISFSRIGEYGKLGREGFPSAHHSIRGSLKAHVDLVWPDPRISQEHRHNEKPAGMSAQLQGGDGHQEAQK